MNYATLRKEAGLVINPSLDSFIPNNVSQCLAINPLNGCRHAHILKEHNVELRGAPQARPSDRRERT